MLSEKMARKVQELYQQLDITKKSLRYFKL